MAEVFRRKATMLAAGFEHENQRDSAREALRGFVERIIIPPGDELLKVGNLGAMLEAASGQKMPGRQAVGLCWLRGPARARTTCMCDGAPSCFQDWMRPKEARGGG